MNIDEKFVIAELRKIAADINIGGTNKSSVNKKRLYVRDLNPGQMKEYGQLTKLNDAGKFQEFGRAVVKFRKKHKLAIYRGPDNSLIIGGTHKYSAKTFKFKGDDLFVLPESPWKYFKKTSDAELYLVKDLKNIRQREKGVKNANKYMLMAYNGEGQKRKPLDLEDNGDGTYTVMDGNSTFANAQLSGWKHIVGHLV